MRHPRAARALLLGVLLLPLNACGGKKRPVDAPAPEPTTAAPAPATPAPATPAPVAPVPVADTPAPAPAAPTPPPAPAASGLAGKVDEAIALIERGTAADLERAIQILEPAAVEDATGTVRVNLGIAYQKRGDYARATNQYTAVTASNPANGDAWAYLAGVQQLQGQKSQAESTIQTGVRNAPENVSLRIALINSLRDQGKLDAAIEESKKALGIHAKSMGIYNAFGLCYLARNDFTLARFIFDKAVREIEGANENALLHTNLGWAYFLEGNTPQATFELKKAVELDPNLVPALVYLSRIYMEDHNYADTIPMLENAARLDPSNAGIALTLGVAYRGVGRLDDAERLYRKALTLDPSDPAPHFNLAVLIGDYRKDYEGAIAEFTQYLSMGGPEKALAEQYIKDVKKEKELAEKRAKAAEDAKRREEERKRKEALLQQEGNNPAPAPNP